MSVATEVGVAERVSYAVETGTVLEFTYNGSQRIVEPEELIAGRGAAVLVGQELDKGYRRYSLDKITNLK